MIRPLRPTILLIALGLTSTALAQRYTGSGPASPALMDLLAPGYRQHAAEQAEDVRGGEEAEKRSDFDAAEAAYRKACVALGYDEPLQHLRLARLFDRTGDGRKAYVEYRVFVIGDERSISSDQFDPTILAHFGDLCARYGPVVDAKKAYALAIIDGQGGYGDGVLLSTARDASLAALRSAAHVAAAIDHKYHLDPKGEEAELNLAIEVDPQNWIARIYRAEVFASQGMRAAATLEGMKAERLAPAGKGREAVRAMRWADKIADENGKLPPAPPVPEGSFTIHVPDPAKKP